MSNNAIKLHTVSWKNAEQHIAAIRKQVFIIEQSVPPELEWDEADNSCMHLLAEYNTQFIATARLLNNGQIGRIAVLKTFRQQGVGTAMMKKLIQLASDANMQQVFLNAQMNAINFYQGFGFIAHGEAFNDAGILHKRMTLNLNNKNLAI